MNSLTNTIKDLYIHFGYAGLAFTMMLENMGIPIPSEIILPLAGFMVASHVFSFSLALLFALIGGLAGSLIAYSIGNKGGIPLVKKYGKYLLIRESDIDWADKIFQKYGDWIVSISRLMPIVRTYISFPAGFAKMKASKFIIYTLIGSLPWTIVLIFGGIQLGNHWDKVGGILTKFKDVVLVLLAILVFMYVYTHLKRRQESKSPGRKKS